MAVLGVLAVRRGRGDDGTPRAALVPAPARSLSQLAPGTGRPAPTDAPSAVAPKSTGVAQAALVCTGIALLTVAAVHQEPRMYALGGVWLGGAVLAGSASRRTATTAALALGILGLIAGSPAYRFGLTHFRSVADFGPATAALAGSALTVMAAVDALAAREGRRARIGPAIGLGTAGLVAALVAASFVATLAARTSVSDADTAGAARVAMRDVQFAPRTIRASAGQPVRVVVRNDDLIVHTFTLEAAGIDANLGPGSEKLFELDLAPGRYDFRCTVPGHEAMTGTLIIN